MFYWAALLLWLAPHVLGELIEHESLERVPREWKLDSHIPDGGQILSLRLALAETAQDYLEVATAVSDPQSPRYGEYLDSQQLQRLIHSSSPDPVKAWLVSSGAHDISHQNEWLYFDIALKDARQMLAADFRKYSSKDGQEPVFRALSYSIPRSLTRNVEFIHPITFFHRVSDPVPKSKRQGPTGPANCTNSVCPEQIRTKYKIDYTPPDTKSGARVGVAGFLEQYSNHADNAYFQTHYANLRSATDFNVELVNGGKDPQNETLSGVEAMLDIEYVQAFTGPLNVTFFSTGGRPPTLNQHGTKPISAKASQNEPFLDLLDYLLQMQSPPQVLSISYSDTEQSVPHRYAKKVCSMFARLAARGVSVIGASGDGGATGTLNSDCKRPDGSTMFLPTFPSSCPWYTSVGAAAGYGGAAAYSSGGFSNYFSVPAWQKEATTAYINAIGKRHAGYYNSSGRGIPDVAVLGDDFLIWQDKAATSHDGTSASTPVFASIIALINDLRLRSGKPVLGFLNPLLYSKNVTAIFTDIKTGQTNGCANKTGFEPGWTARTGWDPATGIGAPDFAKLRQLLV